MTDKEFFSIKEVAAMLELKPYILRYWEKEFAILKPKRNRVGRRYYSKKDIEIVKLIKNILYEQGFTIAGAKKKLVTLSEGPEQLSLPLRNKNKILREIKTELKKINDLLEV
jgi:DNA-binding transcriptional MerR regulator